MAKEKKFDEEQDPIKGKKRDFRAKKQGRKSETGESDYKRASKHVMNDPLWYVIHPELLKDVANFAYPQWIGRGFPTSLGSVGSGMGETVVLKLPFLFTFGFAQQASDPVNLAIRNLYTFVRHQNSGHTNYESPDLGMYLLATGGVIACLAHLERCLGIAKYYSTRNSAVPYTLAKALGITNLTAFTNNLANYTAKLNTLWQRVSSMCIPKDFKFIQRWIWMCSQVFKDHESDKAALIVFKPISVPTFEDTKWEAGAIEQFNKEALTPTIDDWYLACEGALNNLLDDEDMNIISGDILKAYGRENMLSFGMTSTDYMVEPVYVEEMLPQVQHAMTPPASGGNNGITMPVIATGITPYIGGLINDNTNPRYVAAQDKDVFGIYQWNGEIVCTPCPEWAGGPVATIAGNALYWGNQSKYDFFPINHTGRFLNSYEKSPTPEYNIIASRLMLVLEPDDQAGSAGQHGLYFTGFGTEIICGFDIFTTYKFGGGVPVTSDITLTSDYVCGSTSYQSQALNFKYVLLMSQLDWHPFIYYWEYTPGAQDVNNGVKNFAGDIDNFTVISNDNIKAMHLNACLAEFSVTAYNLIK